MLHCKRKEQQLKSIKTTNRTQPQSISFFWWIWEHFIPKQHRNTNNGLARPPKTTKPEQIRFFYTKTNEKHNILTSTKPSTSVNLQTLWNSSEINTSKNNMKKGHRFMPSHRYKVQIVDFVKHGIHRNIKLQTYETPPSPILFSIYVFFYAISINIVFF